jgi:hypothetical protein
MEAAFEGVWPGGVPTTLWNYGLLQPEHQRVLPFMGIRPDWGFLLAFLFGACVIAFFARQRFRQRTFDPSSFDYRVLRELAPTQLRGPGPMRRAYAYYAGTLIAVYAAMTFFGGLILSTVGAIPMAGLQVEVSNAVLHSAQWPLTLALALAGFAPLIRPLEIIETWLRQKAHQWVGIPVKIKDHTRNLLRHLESIVSDDASAERQKLPSWVVAHIEETDSVTRVMVARKELELLVKLTRDEDGWPSVGVREEMKRLEGDEIAQAEIALQDFDEILATEFHALEAGREKKAGAPQNDALKKHQRRLEANLTKAIQRIEWIREEFGSIFTIYAERDTNYANIRDPQFRAVMRRAFPDDQAPPGPDHAILILLIPVFLIYVAATAVGLHSLLGGVNKVAVTVLATAALETLRIATIFWLPLLVVFFWRNHLKKRGDWQPIRLGELSGGVVRRLLTAMGLALVAALLGLGLLALLWMAIIADNPVRYRELLFSGSQPALTYFFSQAGAAALCAAVAVCAADRAELARDQRYYLFPHGLICAFFVSAWMAAHLIYWSGFDCNPAYNWFVEGGCFRRYNLTDLIVCFVVAYFAAGVFARPARAVVRPMAVGGAESGILSKSAVGAVVLLALIFPSGVFAQTGQVFDRKKVIVAGFREDAEPFSYVLGTGKDRNYKGYIAQLCYKIFEGSDYSIVSVAVTADDRFRRLRKKRFPAYDPQRPDEDQKIDILCDPITLRFSDPAARADGIFSPIVFASGVSYLLRRSRLPRSDTYLAFVANSTAPAVAKLACQIDLFGVGRNKETISDCDEQKNAGCPGNRVEQSSGEPRYLFCIFRTHTELIEWFCQGDGDLGFQVAYFGDREIILSKLSTWTEQKGCPTSWIEQRYPYYTYEPYALLISKARPDLVQFVQRRIFEFFSHRSEAISLFTTYFPGVQMSPTVANLFLLNAVAEEKFFRFPPPADKGDKQAPATNLTATAR